MSGPVGRLRRGVARRLVTIFGPRLYGRDDIEKVFRFFRDHPDFRTPAACAQETGLPVSRCLAIKTYLYHVRRLGSQSFGRHRPPYGFMKQRILDRFAWIGRESKILEIGPGQHPIFAPEEYPGWWGADKYYRDDAIAFKGADWARGRYPRDRMVAGSWEDLTGAFAGTGMVGRFDVVVASHSYEHVFAPVRSIAQAGEMLRGGGGLALFVPDGRADDPTTRGEPTHTLFPVPEMIREFFEHAGGFADLTIETFRPNCDLFIAAERRS